MSKQKRRKRQLNRYETNRNFEKLASVDGKFTFDLSTGNIETKV